MHNDLEANESKVFVIQHSIIQVKRILFTDTKCSQKSCDRQNHLLNNNKLCGRFIMKSSFSNIISMHSIGFYTDTGEKKMMRKFISLKILETLKRGNLSVHTHASRLQSDNNAYNYIVDFLEEIVNLVNSEGGWTVYGWDKRGLINDVSLLCRRGPSQDVP